jgi:hypothetical protein
MFQMAAETRMLKALAALKAEHETSRTADHLQACVFMTYIPKRM